jgi:hypothetical protein
MGRVERDIIQRFDEDRLIDLMFMDNYLAMHSIHTQTHTDDIYLFQSCQSYRQVQHSLDLEVAMFCFGLVGSLVVVLVGICCCCFASLKFMSKSAIEGTRHSLVGSTRFTYPVVYACAIYRYMMCDGDG